MQMIRRHAVTISLVAALCFYFFELELVGSATMIPGIVLLAKGAAVGALAVWALNERSDDDARLLGGVLAMGAAGDIAIEWSLIAGAAFFLVGHLGAIWLYRRAPRAERSPSQNALALVVLLGVPVLAYLLPAERDLATLAAIYAVALAAMAACAWISRYSRYRVGIGAMLFVASDLLIFARSGPLASSAIPTLLVWPCYYLGQFCIATGVMTTLRRNRQRPDDQPSL